MRGFFEKLDIFFATWFEFAKVFRQKATTVAKVPSKKSIKFNETSAKLEYLIARVYSTY